MGKNKKRRLREKKEAAEKKSGWLGVAKNALKSRGTTLAVVGLALGPLAAVMPWGWAITTVVETCAYVLPAVGTLIAVKDVAVPIIEGEQEKAEDEALSARILLLTDGKGLRESTFKACKEPRAEVCYAIYPEDVADEEDDLED